jgi:O-antigen ligase
MVHVLVLALVSVPLSSVFLGLGGDALETMGRDATLTGRTVIWDLVLAEAGNPVVGTGFESFWLGDRLTRIQNIHVGLNESHNGYLEIFLTLGWIGVLLLAIVIVTGYGNIMASFRQSPNEARLRMALFISAVVLSFTEAGFRMLNINWITFLMAIMAVPEDRSQGSRPDSMITPTSEQSPVETESVAVVGSPWQSSSSAGSAVGTASSTRPPSAWGNLCPRPPARLGLGGEMHQPGADRLEPRRSVVRVFS